jgi:hypothetical protein
MGFNLSDDIGTIDAPWKKRHQSITFTDPFTGTTQHANTEAEKAAYLEMRRKQEFRKKLRAYDEEALKWRDQRLSDFSSRADYEAARQVGGISAVTGLEAQRRGLGDTFAAALDAQGQAQLRSEVVSSNLDFASKLGQLQYADRMGFVRGEFDFMNRLQAMNYANELSKDLARFQSNLASNISMRDILGSIMDIGGTAVGIHLAGSVWGAAGNTTSGRGFPGGQGYEDPNYGIG